MAHWCESCGQEVPDGLTHPNATWLGEPQSLDDSFSPPAGVRRSGRDKKLLLAVAGALAVWVLFVGLGRIVTPDDAIDEQAAAEIDEARAEQVAQEAQEAEAQAAAEAAEQAREAELAEAASDDEDDDAALAVADTTDNDGRVAVSVQVERLQRQLTRRDSAAFIAYRSREGIVVVDLVAGESAVTEMAPGVSALLPGTHLLRSGADTYAIDPETLSASRVAQDSSIAMSETLDGHIYLVDSGALSGQGAIIEVVADGEYGFHRLPPGGLQIHPVDGLGVLAVPKNPTGETLIAGADSFRTLSPNRVLTGTSDALLEQVCPTEDRCELVITDLASGESNQVPTSFVRFGDQYSLAPNGDALLRYSPEGFGEVYISGTESILWVIGAGMRSPAWGPNSDFIAWIDRIGDPKLKVMFPDERDWLTIDLRDLGAPPPASDELIVFTGEFTPAVALDS